MRETEYSLADTEVVFVCALMLNPGRHQYVIKLDNELVNETPHTFFSKQIIENKLPNYKSFKQLKAKFVMSRD